MGWTPTLQHPPHTHRDTEPLYQHLAFAMAFVTGATHSNTKPVWPLKHPPRPPARAPILQTSRCTHNTRQSGHRCPRDRRSGQSSPGAQQQHPPVQLRAGNRVLFRVGGHAGEVGGTNNTYRQHSKWGGGAGAGGALPARRALCRARAGICWHTARAPLPTRLARGTGSGATLGTADQSCLPLSLREVGLQLLEGCLSLLQLLCLLLLLLLLCLDLLLEPAGFVDGLCLWMEMPICDLCQALLPIPTSPSPACPAPNCPGASPSYSGTS